MEWQYLVANTQILQSAPPGHTAHPDNKPILPNRPPRQLHRKRPDTSARSTDQYAITGGERRAIVARSVEEREGDGAGEEEAGSGDGIGRQRRGRRLG